MIANQAPPSDCLTPRGQTRRKNWTEKAGLSWQVVALHNGNAVCIVRNIRRETAEAIATVLNGDDSAPIVFACQMGPSNIDPDAIRVLALSGGVRLTRQESNLLRIG
ncbi:hypothetical protein DSM3645_24415 [Blastopirellula marina DSM 3645]|uniref:Uncharacterized protein n=1 Tax=Blastopirellula marina DSM 3645 TaxID=314230 RepID=A3ZUX4_9BACT|nr:hypothetical protein DSM3645_24415 [Blastopirellula marina DSM 3645]